MEAQHLTTYPDKNWNRNSHFTIKSVQSKKTLQTAVCDLPNETIHPSYCNSGVCLGMRQRWALLCAHGLLHSGRKKGTCEQVISNTVEMKVLNWSELTQLHKPLTTVPDRVNKQTNKQTSTYKRVKWTFREPEENNRLSDVSVYLRSSLTFITNLTGLHSNSLFSFHKNGVQRSSWNVASENSRMP